MTHYPPNRLLVF